MVCTAELPMRLSLSTVAGLKFTVDGGFELPPRNVPVRRVRVWGIVESVRSHCKENDALLLVLSDESGDKLSVQVPEAVFALYKRIMGDTIVQGSSMDVLGSLVCEKVQVPLDSTEPVSATTNPTSVVEPRAALIEVIAESLWRTVCTSTGSDACSHGSSEALTDVRKRREIESANAMSFYSDPVWAQVLSAPGSYLK